MNDQTDETLKTTLLKSPSLRITEALEPPAPTGLLTSEDDAQQRVWLSEREHTVGRDAGSSVRIDRPGISRTHARFLVDGGRWVLEDAGSRNGVWVNGARVEGRVWLSDGDEVRFSRYTFRFELKEPDEALGERTQQIVRGDAGEDGDESESEVPLDLEIQPFEADDSPRREATPRGSDSDAAGANRTAAVVARLAPHDEALAEVLLRRALEGEPAALQLVAERLWPVAPAAGDAEVPDDSLLDRVGQLLRSHRRGRLSRSQAETMLRSLVLDPDHE